MQVKEGVCAVPSAPVSSTIALTFFAKSFRLSSFSAACEKPVSPQPPIATMIDVPTVNFDRTSSTVVKNGHEVELAWLKVEDCMKAIATWVISETSAGFGTLLCCLRCLSGSSWENVGGGLPTLSDT